MFRIDPDHSIHSHHSTMMLAPQTRLWITPDPATDAAARFAGLRAGDVVYGPCPSCLAAGPSTHPTTTTTI